MKDTYYFSHDYNTREDEKIKNLIFELGFEGYGLYWALVESLYQNDGYMQTHYNRIAHELHTQSDLIESVINNFNLFKTHDNLFFSKSVLHRLKLRKGKTLTARKAAQIRWGKEIQDNANAMQMQCDSNAIKERKGKEIKLKEIKEFPEMKNTFLSFYKTKKNLDYYFTGKDAGNLKQLINKLKATLKSVGKEANLTDTFAGFLNAINDEWILENLSISLINSKYNEILSKIRKGRGTKGYRGDDKYERAIQLLEDRERTNK